MDGSVFITGFLLSTTLIVAIGAQNAYVLRQGLRREHVGAIVLFCALCDALLIAAGVAGVGSVLRGAPGLAMALTVCGALFLVAYGARALLRAWRPGALSAAAGNGPVRLGPALAQAAAFTLLNPHVYLDTVLLVGAIGGRYPAAAQPWFVAGAAAASGAWFSALGFGARLLSPWFAKPSAWRVLDAVVGLTMWLLAAGLVMSALGA